MISSTLRIVLLSGIFFYFFLILIFLKNKTLHLRYTLLWLAAGIVLAVLVIWPYALVGLVRMLGIASNMNGLFVVSIAFIIMIVMSLTSIISKQADKIKNLTQTIARMEKRIRELEEKQKE